MGIIKTKVNKHEKSFIHADDSYVEDLELKLRDIKSILNLAEEWSKSQELPESSIAISALKDIRRIMSSVTITGE